MNYYCRLIIQSLAVLVTSTLLSLMLLQEEPWFKRALQEAVEHAAAQALNAHVSCAIKQVNISTGYILCSEVEVHARDTTWSYACPALTIQVSWLKSLINALLEIDIVVYQSVITSAYSNGQLALIRPIKEFLSLPVIIPVHVRTCAITQSKLLVRDDATQATASLLFSSTMSQASRLVSIVTSCIDGVVTYADSISVQKISGTITYDVPFDVDISRSFELGCLQAHIVANAALSSYSLQRCMLSLLYKHNQGSCKISLGGDAVQIDIAPIRYHHTHWSAEVKATGPVQLLAAYMPSWVKADALGGTYTLEGHAELGDTLRYYATARLHNGVYKAFMVPTCTLVINGDHQQAYGSISCAQDSGSVAHGSWDVNFSTRQGSAKLSLVKPLSLFSSLPSTLDPEQSSIACIYNRGALAIEYTVNLGVQGRSHKLSGYVKTDMSRLTASGSYDKYTYTLACSLQPSLILEQLRCKDEHNRTCIKGEKGTDNTIKIMVTWSFVQELMRYWAGIAVPGQGIVTLLGNYTGSGYTGTLELSKANIKLPYVYNLINHAMLSFCADFSKKLLTLRDITLDLYKGKLSVSQADLLFSPTGTLVYAHMPCMLSNCFISAKKQFFGLISGAVTLVYNLYGSSFVQGDIILERSHLQGNLLSSKVHQDLMGTFSVPPDYKQDISLNVHIITRHLLEVKAPFLQTNARIDVMCKGALFNPEISGLIELADGTFLFPYKPLYIKMGKIYLTPHQLNNPTVELIAKNTLKKYTITMHITGSALHPKIAFDAWPSLQEEQIITLLLAGSEEGSLSLAMPSMVMRQLENLVFGAEHPSSLQHYLKALCKPFKHVRITPSLSDQTAEGRGVQGSVEIDINDRLRAKVRNNLQLSDITQLEVEYMLSDDVSVKALKDEQGNVGGELEMKWKL